MNKNIFVQSARFSHQRDTYTLLIVDLKKVLNYSSCKLTQSKQPIPKIQIMNFYEFFDHSCWFGQKKKDNNTKQEL